MILAETKDFSAFIETLKDKKSAETGLLIGSWISDKPHIYFQSRTPSLEIQPQKGISALLSTPLTPPEALYSDWVLEHSNQLSRLLPGGLDIIGLFMVSDEELNLESFAFLPSGLLSLLNDLSIEVLSRNSVLLMHFNSCSYKYTLKIVDLKVKLITAGDLKLVQLPKLEEIRCFLKVNLEAAGEGIPQLLIQDILKEWNVMLHSCIIFIDKQLKSDQIIGNLKQGINAQDKGFHIAEIYSKNYGFCSNEQLFRINIQGFIESRVLVTQKMTIKEARDLIIKDILFSMKDRLEIVSDEFTVEKNPFLAAPLPRKIQLPRRVFYSYNSCVLSSYISASQEENIAQAYTEVIASVKLTPVDSVETLPKVETKHEENSNNSNKIDSNSEIFSYTIFGMMFMMLFISFIVKAYY
ncbi:unnamed protein product [Blepharisma stoltei]|uniref:Uncharacterized protein n=1 Tax=Blepharisma stoltei TaxID=1481888 RepID=A0AAU9JQ25_9CILI|nr:unnamed protein product [Blepharisma stoltei]